jgi:protease-4
MQQQRVRGVFGSGLDSSLWTGLMYTAAVSACVLVPVVPAAAQAGAVEKAVTVDKAVVGLLDIKGAVAERPGPFDWLRASPEPSLRALTTAIHTASERGEMRALVLRLQDAALTLTQVEELGAAVRQARDSGKQVFVVSEGFSTSHLLLGAHADRVVGQSGEAVSLPGLSMDEWYLRDMLNWIGIEPSFEQIGAYKGADEAITRAEPSGPWEQNISQLLDSMYGNIRGILTSGRGLTEAELDSAMQKAWFATTDEAVVMGLIDESIPLSELSDELGNDLGAEVSWRSDLLPEQDGFTFNSSNPFAMFAMLSRDPSNKPVRPSLAVVHIDGPIVDGDSSEGGLFGSSSVGSRTIRRILDDLGEDELIRGVVLRINSPGGSATASEVIWQAARRVAETKPVYVSVGSMAASGGYYIAVAGDKIFVNPSSIVGSIGVVTGKLAMAGLYDKLKINVVSRNRGPMAGLFGPDAWTEQERTAVRTTMQDTYDLFTSRVTSGREGIELASTAEGRLFTGDKAVGLKMADEIGSLDQTLTALAGQVGLESYDVLDYPGPLSFEEIFDEFLSAEAPISGLRVDLAGIESGLRAMVGPAWPAVRERIDAAVMLQQTPVTVMEHRVLHFR